MLTTARKIEIAKAVMQDSRLGITETICSVIEEIEPNGHRLLRKELWIYYRENGGTANYSSYWFIKLTSLARTERIEFLKKYIEHLKKQENE